MPGIFYTPLPAPGFGGSTGPLPGCPCSSADTSQVLPAVSSVISVLTWSYNVAGAFMQMQYLLGNLYPFRCFDHTTHRVSHAGETSKVAVAFSPSL